MSSCYRVTSHSPQMALQADEATVLRDKKLITVPAAQLVPGDIVEVAGKLATHLLSLFNEFFSHKLLIYKSIPTDFINKVTEQNSYSIRCRQGCLDYIRIVISWIWSYQSREIFCSHWWTAHVCSGWQDSSRPKNCSAQLQELHSGSGATSLVFALSTCTIPDFSQGIRSSI